MFNKTDNPYKFKYITTAISGDGIKEVYLPIKPQESAINDFGGKWQKIELPEEWEKWEQEESEGLKNNPDYIHPFIESFTAREWERRMNGFWFWNTVNGRKEATYITGLHYFYLCWWTTMFEDSKTFRDPDREIFYLLQYADEDPKCLGILLGTIRRYGKSAILGCWLMEPIMRERRKNAGMQGETDRKIKEFYIENILYPFRRLPKMFTPVYNEASTLMDGVQFYPTISKGKNQKKSFKTESLDSKINYGPSDVNYYNRAKLFRYGGEEAGKVMEVDVYTRHDKVKPAMKTGALIFGKMFYATTADETSSKVESFEKMFYDSDFDDKEANGQTKTGLYAAFLPGYYGYEGYFDEFGVPLWEAAKESLIIDRKSYENQPSKLIGLIRQYPFTISEYFYTNAGDCLFNVKILQDRKTELMLNKKIIDVGDFDWTGGNKHSGKISYTPNSSGRFKISYLPPLEDRNKVRQNGEIDGVKQWEPLNTAKYVIGCDPIDWTRKTVSNKRSKPVLYVIRKYDPQVDGIHSDEDFEQMALNRHPFETGFPIVRCGFRPEDPTTFYKWAISLCVFFGCQIHIEQQKASGLMGYMRQNGYGAFIMNRPEITYTKFNTANQVDTDGTPASKGTTQLFTGLIATNCRYFGHRYPFIELIEDMLTFDVDDTLLSDDTVAFGFGLLGVEKKEHNKTTTVDLSKYFHIKDNTGYVSVV